MQVEEYLRLGASPDGELAGGSPLHWASQNGHARIVTLLLQAAADVNPSPATHAILTVLEAGETVRKTPFGNKTVYSVKHILQQ